jgi:hypothetical protein
VADVFVADHSFNPGWAGAALVIAVCAFCTGRDCDDDRR